MSDCLFGHSLHTYSCLVGVGNYVLERSEYPDQLTDQRGK